MIKSFEIKRILPDGRVLAGGFLLKPAWLDNLEKKMG